MSATTLEPLVKAKKRVRRAPQYNVIYNRGAQNVRVCSVRLLQDVFKITEAEAKEHVKRASAVGRSIIMTDFFEVAEMRTLQANEQARLHTRHNKQMASVSFKLEKA